MSEVLNILLTNDDGYRAAGIHVLAEIMCQFGSVTAVAPKFHQSGMSMAVSMGGKAIAYKELSSEDGARWYYLDATPASCVKYGLDEVFWPGKPDVVVCGINHGSNAATAANYSGTLGAAEEAALNGILGVGVSLDTMSPDADFSVVKEFFPEIFRTILANLPSRGGIFYNVNFPNIPASAVKGVRVGHQGMGHWEKEFKPWNADSFAARGLRPEDLGHTSSPVTEKGERLYMMVGDFKDDSPADDRLADHHIISEGYISVVAHNIDNTDREEIARLDGLGFNKDF